MARARRLKREEMTYSWAQDQEKNVLIALDDHEHTRNQFNYMWNHSALLEQAVAHHLGISPRECKVDTWKNWMSGSYNLCIPILIPGQRKVLMRFPLLHRVGEFFRSGNSDEKIRCEAGTYAWLNENCPSVPVPKLYGFALAAGQTFTAVESLPWLPRYFHYFRCRILKLLGCAVPSKYVRHQGPSWDAFHAGYLFNAGYLLIEYIDGSKGTMLSSSWELKKHDNNLRGNLFKGLSRIILNIAKVPVPRIGSFAIDDSGFLVLSNRPLSPIITEMEATQIPVHIPRNMTYSSVSSYVTDVLAIHDSRFTHQPNALTDNVDGQLQAAALTAMRAVTPRFFDHELRRGPFIYVLNDLHQSNILVDKDWNVTCLIDLEFACSQPIEMLHPPRWFTNRYVDKIDPDHFSLMHQEFVTLMEQQEKELYPDTVISISNIMRRGLDKKTFWYSLALISITGLYHIFFNHIEKIFSPDIDNDLIKLTYKFWTSDMDAFIAKKIEDKAAYDKRLQEELNVGVTA